MNSSNPILNSIALHTLRAPRVLVALGAIAATCIPADASSTPLRREARCEYSYSLVQEVLTPKSPVPGCGSRTLRLVTGDVAVFSAPSASNPKTEISGKCIREVEECVVICWTNKVPTPVTHNISAPFEYTISFAGKQVGGLKPGSTKLFVAPKDGPLTLATIPVGAHMKQAVDQVSKLCPSGQEREDVKTEYWFSKQAPKITLTQCRPDTSGKPSDCPEVKP